MSLLENNFAALETRIQKACAKAQRHRASVVLIAVSKLHPIEVVQEAFALGHRDFGENYAQELRDKSQQFSPSEIVWHAIGSVQKKNAKYIARAAHFFHALDSIEIAQELSKHREGPEPLSCFVQVNVAHESSKSGIAPAELSSFVRLVQTLPGIRCIGLTAMPPLSENSESSRKYFQDLKHLGDQANLQNLSMGTTQDFEMAIEEGATHIRVGTALFGERPSTSAIK